MIPLDPSAFALRLARLGVVQVAGVPCSILEPLARELDARPDLRTTAASVEGEAVAIAAGCWLAGGLGAVLMQNSGLGNAVNPLLSLAAPYRIPVVLLVSWRGEPGRTDAVHHAPTGAATRPLLDLLGMPALPVDGDLDEAFAAAARRLHERQSVALLVRRGSFAASRRALPAPGAPVAADDAAVRFEGGPAPSRAHVIAAYLAVQPTATTVSTTGFISRELSALGGRAWHFPMQGSMGFALGIGLGIALAQQTRPVWVLDGDGALVMRLGSLATVGTARPERLVHLVLDDGVYASTGGQPAPRADFARVALACGYRRAASCHGREALGDALAWTGAGAGPTLLHVSISGDDGAGRERPSATPPELASALRHHHQEAG